MCKIVTVKAEDKLNLESVAWLPQVFLRMPHLLRYKIRTPVIYLDQHINLDLSL